MGVANELPRHDRMDGLFSSRAPAGGALILDFLIGVAHGRTVLLGDGALR